MKIGIYSIRDKVADEFGPMFCSKNDEVACRSFRDMVAKHNLSEEDFELQRAGWYDTESRDSAGLIEISYDPQIINVKSWRQVDLEN